MQVTIKNKEYGLHWGLGAFEIASEVFEIPADVLFMDSLMYKLKDDVDEIDYEKPLRVREQVIFGAIVNHCEENDIAVDFTYSQFRNAYNEFDEETHTKLISEFKKSKYVGKVVSELLDEAMSKMAEPKKDDVKKKKVTSRRSSKTA